MGGSCSSPLKQGGPWLDGTHTRKELVPVSPASPQAHGEVAAEEALLLA